MGPAEHIEKHAASGARGAAVRAARCGLPSESRLARALRAWAAAGVAALLRASLAAGDTGQALTSARELDFPNYHLKAGAGWAPPAALSMGKWVFTYA